MSNKKEEKVVETVLSGRVPTSLSQEMSLLCGQAGTATIKDQTAAAVLMWLKAGETERNRWLKRWGKVAQGYADESRRMAEVANKILPP